MNFESVKLIIEKHINEYHETHNALHLVYVQGVINGITALCETKELLTVEEREYLTVKFSMVTVILFGKSMKGTIENDKE